MLRFPCPSCNAPLWAPEALAGRPSHCYHCRQPLTVPAPPRPMLRRLLAFWFLGIVLAALVLVLVLVLQKRASPPAPGPGKGPAAEKHRHDMTLNAYIGLAPEEPKVFTLKCVLDDYYNYEFEGGREQFYSFRMRDRLGEAIHGYAEKNTPLGRRLISILGDGFEHVITLEVRRGENARHVEILRIFG